MGNEVASLPQEKFSILFCLIIKGKIFAILCLFTILILNIIIKPYTDCQRVQFDWINEIESFEQN